MRPSPSCGHCQLWGVPAFLIVISMSGFCGEESLTANNEISRGVFPELAEGLEMTDFELAVAA